MQTQTDGQMKNTHQKAARTFPLLALNLPQSLPSLIFHHFHFYPPHSQNRLFLSLSSLSPPSFLFPISVLPWQFFPPLAVS